LEGGHEKGWGYFPSSHPEQPPEQLELAATLDRHRGHRCSKLTIGMGAWQVGQG
jgi:hypothetical protein